MRIRFEAMRVRRPLQAATGVLLCAALAWCLLRFGATEPWTLYGLFLALAAAALVALPALRPERLEARRWLPVALVGAWILAQAAFRPTLAAQGYVHLGVGWLALALTLWLGGSRRAARGLFLFLVLVGAAEAVFALLELRGTVSAIARNPGIQRHLAVGTLINPNHFAGLVNMTLALACGGLLALLGRDPDRRRGPVRFAGAAGLLGAIALMALASHRAESHGGMLALAAALVWIGSLAALRRSPPLRRRLLTRHGLVGAAVVAGLLAAAGIGVAVPRSGILSLQHRAEVYQETLLLIRDHPLLGVGPGMYMWRFRPYQSFNVDGLYVHAHNDYLQTAAEWGVPVALLSWAFVGWRLLRSARRCLSAKDPWEAGIALGCSGAIAVILVHSLVDFNLQIPGNWMLFSMIIGLAWSLEPGPRGREGPEPPRAARAPRLLTWLALPLLLLAAGLASARQLTAIQLGRKAPEVAALEAAVGIDPRNPDLRLRLALPYRDDLAAQDLAKARRHLEEAVRLNPHAWWYRLELAQLYELLGLDEEAAGAYRAALRLNPHSPRYHWQAANFLLRAGDLEGSLALFQKALTGSAGYRAMALRLLLAEGATLAQIEDAWPDDRTARADLLNRILRHDDLERTRVTPRELVEAWSRLQRDGPPLALDEGTPLLQYLLDRGLHEEARRVWVDLAAGQDQADEAFAGKANYLWNGDFALPLSDGLLSWQSRGPKRTGFVARVADSPRGSRAFAVDLGDGPNVDFLRLQQLAIVDPGASYDLMLATDATVAWKEATATTLRVRDWRQGGRLLAVELAAPAPSVSRFSYGLEIPTETSVIEIVIEARVRRGVRPAPGARWWLDSVVLARTGSEVGR